jgi:ammonia channel protein AmtB
LWSLVLLSLGAGLVTAGIALMIYFVVGLCSGVLGMCSVASGDWETKFDDSIILIPIAGLVGVLIVFAMGIVKRNRPAPKANA